MPPSSGKKAWVLQFNHKTVDEAADKTGVTYKPWRNRLAI
jgi:hypothetical protein